jgi:hypothetical protein
MTTFAAQLIAAFTVDAQHPELLAGEERGKPEGVE